MIDRPFNQGVIPFKNIRDGVYLVKKQSTAIPRKQHYGVLVVGWPLRLFGFYGSEPIIIHRTETIRVEFAEATDSVWEIVDETPSHEIVSAAARASEEFRQPDYSVLTDNCEHTARYIVLGVRQSTQVASFVAGAIGVGFLLWLANDN